MSVLVFGKTGQVAMALQRLGDPGMIFLDRGDADLSDPDACGRAIMAIRPGAVINAAAYTAVDRAEEEEALATTINGEAPGMMATVCAGLEIPLLHISTDYVFDGSGKDAWQTTDQTGPVSAYGRSKLAGENAVRAAGGAHVILRTAWVFSADGSNFVKTMLRLAETRDTLAVVADQVGGPTPASGIATCLAAMAKALRAGQAGGTYHYSGAPDVSWADFARAIFDVAGRSVSVKDIPSSDYPTPARRPLNSRLDCSSLFADFGIHRPSWRASLEDILKERTI